MEYVLPKASRSRRKKLFLKRTKSLAEGLLDRYLATTEQDLSEPERAEVIEALTLAVFDASKEHNAEILSKEPIDPLSFDQHVDNIEKFIKSG